MNNLHKAVFILSSFFLPVLTSGQTDSAAIYYNNGVEQEQAQEYQQAFTCFQKAVNLKPEYADAQVGLARTAVELRKFDLAAAALQRGLEIKKKEQEKGGGITYFSGNPEQLAAAMAYAEKQGMLKTGKNEWHITGNTYTEVEPGKKNRDTGWTIVPMTETAFDLLLANPPSTDPAPADLQPASSQNAQEATGLAAHNQENVKNAEIAYLVARGFMKQQNYRAAAPFLEQAVRIDTSNVVRAYECALNFSAIPDPARAIEYYLLATSRGYPADAAYYKNLSLAYKAAGQQEKSRECDTLLKNIVPLSE